MTQVVYGNVQYRGSARALSSIQQEGKGRNLDEFLKATGHYRKSTVQPLQPQIVVPYAVTRHPNNLCLKPIKRQTKEKSPQPIKRSAQLDAH